jgi:hypothetical protein
MADVASRRIPEIEDSAAKLDIFEPTLPPNFKFLTYFAARFPLPQPCCWQIATPMPEMLSNVISTLRGKRLQLQRWTQLPELQVGNPGKSMHTSVNLTHSFEMCPSRSNNNPCWPLPPGFELDATGMVGKLDSRASKKPSVTWHKPKFWQDSPTPEDDMARKS